MDTSLACVAYINVPQTKAYSFEYATIPKTFFKTHHAIPFPTCVLGHSCWNIIQDYRGVLGLSWTNVSPNNYCSTMSSNNDLRSFCFNVIRDPTVGQQTVSTNGGCLIPLLTNNGFRPWTRFWNALLHNNWDRCIQLLPNNAVEPCGQTDRHNQAIRCYSITLERDEHSVGGWGLDRDGWCYWKHSTAPSGC